MDRHLQGGEDMQPRRELGAEEQGPLRFQAAKGKKAGDRAQQCAGGPDAVNGLVGWLMVRVPLSHRRCPLFWI